jgi:hypothetical protein
MELGRVFFSVFVNDRTYMVFANTRPTDVNVSLTETFIDLETKKSRRP